MRVGHISVIYFERYVSGDKIDALEDIYLYEQRA